MNRKKLIEEIIPEKFAKAQDVPVTMTEDTITLIVENNTFESNRVIARTVEYCDMLYNPVDKIIELNN